MKNSFRKLLAMSLAMVTGLFCVYGAAGASAVTTSASGSEPATVTVNGYGIAKGKPDVASIVVGVMNTEKKVKDATDKTAKGIEEIKKAVVAKGIKAEDISTDAFYLMPNFDYSGNKGYGVVSGFQAQHMLRIRVANVDLVGEILDAAFTAGANNANGIEFTSANSKDLESKALESAFADAKARAEVLAKASGKTLGDIVKITTGESYNMPMYKMETAAADSAAGTQITPGAFSIQENVSVTFLLK